MSMSWYFIKVVYGNKELLWQYIRCSLIIKYGILGTGTAAVIPSAMMVFLTFYEAGKIIDKSFLAIVTNIVPAAVGSLVMVSLVVLLQQFVSHLSPVLVLVLSIGLGAISHSVFIRLT